MGRCEEALGPVCPTSPLSLGGTWCAQPGFGQAQKEEGILGVGIQVSGCWVGVPFGVLFSGFQVAWVSHVPRGAEEGSFACCRHAV